MASAPWCKSQLQGTSLGVGRKEQLVLLEGAKLFYGGGLTLEQSEERERRSREGRWGHPDWEGAAPPPFTELHLSIRCWESIMGALQEQEQFGFLLGHCSCIFCFSLCITGDSEEIQIAHRFFFSVWERQDLS